MVAWRKFDSFEKGTAFGGWFLTIARYEALSHRRRLAALFLLGDELERGISQCRGFKATYVTMLLALLAFNLNTICRSELEDAVGGGWDMRSFVESIWKVGGRAAVVTPDRAHRRLACEAAQAERWSRLHASTGARSPARSASSVTAPIATRSDVGEGAIVRSQTELTPK